MWGWVILGGPSEAFVRFRFGNPNWEFTTKQCSPVGYSHSLWEPKRSLRFREDPCYTLQGGKGCGPDTSYGGTTSAISLISLVLITVLRPGDPRSNSETAELSRVNPRSAGSSSSGRAKI